MSDIEEQLEGCEGELLFVQDELEEARAENRRLKRENKELKKELAKWKPSWDDAPEWAEWLVGEDVGRGIWFQAEPTADDSDTYWRTGGRFERSRPKLWRETKEKRP